MDLYFNQQDLIESICVYTAVKDSANLDTIHADIAFHPSQGFTATANVPGRTRNLNEQELIDAVAVYLKRYHNFNPELLFIDLRYSKANGISASIQVRND